MFSIFKRWQQPRYDSLLAVSAETKGEAHDDGSLCDSEDSEDSETRLLTIPLTPRKSSSHSSRLWRAIPWIISFLFALLSFLLWMQHSKAAHSGAFGRGYATDFGMLLFLAMRCFADSSVEVPSKEAIELELVTFTGGPAFGEDGEFYVPNLGNVDYIGDPSPEVDDAWAKLINGQ
jgi:hypothetical protein